MLRTALHGAESPARPRPLAAPAGADGRVEGDSLLPGTLEDTGSSVTTILCTVPSGQWETLPRRNAGEYFKL